MPDIFTAPRDTKRPVAKTERPKHEKPDPNSYPDLPDEENTKYLHVPGLFSSVMKKPDGLTFAHQDKDERIIIFTRRHFFTNFFWIVTTVLAVFAPFVFSAILHMTGIRISSIPVSYMLVIYIFYYMIVFGYAFYNYIDWFYNIGIITQKRMIDIDFLRLSYIDVAITKLSEIEDVIYKQKGLFPSLFNYGDVVAHTVATFKGREDFVFESVPRPAELVDIISELLGDSQ